MSRGRPLALPLPAGAARLADYVALTKPRVVSLLLFTGLCGLVAGAGGRPELSALLAVLGGGALSAGGANAVNCALDGDLDALMSRTRHRPVPSGSVPAGHALALGSVLNAAAAAWLVLGAGPLAAVLAMAGSAWYVFVYTLWLKRRSTANIVIGGAAGCFPPLVGWAAATGSLDATALALAAVVFLWTPPHFWSLATLLRDDYGRAGVPMLPVVLAPERTARRILVYAISTLAASLAPLLWGGLGPPYAVLALALGAWFVAGATAYLRRPDAARATGLYRCSLVYLAGIFAAAAADRLV